MKSVRLEDVSRTRDNNFDVLRLVAAGLVLVSHSFPLTGHREPLQPHTLGTVGVEIFFATSGFLVTRSWVSEPSLRRYLAKRVRRIFPGLICAVFVTAAAFGTAFSTRSARDYLLSSGVAEYISSNVLLFPQYSIASVFETNPVQAVNGSLWTLPVEFRAYLLLGLLGLVGLVSRRPIANAAGALFVFNVFFELPPSLRLVSLFAAGSLLYLIQDRIVLRLDVALALTLVWLATFSTSRYTAAGMVAIPYLVVMLAYRTPHGLQRLVGKGDVSYGVYVYAFPVQQCIVAILAPVSPYLVIVIAAPVVWLIGYASWRLVESPFLRRRLAGHQSREAAAQASASVA